MASGTTSYSLDEVGNLISIKVLIEFVDDHVAYAVILSTHDYFGHKHLDFDGVEGKARFRAEINDLFRRYGLAYQLTDDGSIIRLVPEEIRAKFVEAVFQTTDDQLDDLLNTARKKYSSPDPMERKEGLEKLWDAFERLKTITVGADKKVQITALIEAAYTEADPRTRFDKEFKELTALGNTYNIRHFETDKLPIPDDAFVDWLFSRCYSAIHAILDKTGRLRR